MINEEAPKRATPHDQLIAEIMDSRVPKTDREWAAAREIEWLRSELRSCRCPRPINQSSYSTGWCVDNGHCGCGRSGHVKGAA